MLLDKYEITVYIRFEAKSTKIRFKVPSDKFFETLRKDNDARLDLWMDSDSNKKHKQFYVINRLKLDKNTGRIDEIELTSENGYLKYDK